MGLTRRELVAAGVAGAGAVLLGGGAAWAREPALERWRRAGDGWWTSRVELPRGADVIGLRGSHLPDAAVRTPGGRWTPIGHGHAGQVSDPVWVGDARVIELRVRRPGDLRLVTVSSGPPAGGAAHAARLPTLERRYAGQPSIIAREAWATRACRPRVYPPGYGSVQMAIVHHTETTNFYSAAQSAAIVRGICLFHIRGNRWNDIGYDFLIDRYGRIFEGRAGGFDEPVIGAHAGGFNAHSTGVALIGSFSGGRPSAAALRALRRLLAFKLSLHGVPARGRTTVTSDGTVFSRYRKGRQVSLNRISGHRDVDTTACPGTALYRVLPALRRDVASAAGTVNALDIATSPVPWLAGQPGQLTGRLGTLAGAPLPGETVVVQAGGTDLLSVTTGPDGSWSAAPVLTQNATLRAVFAGHGRVRAVVSDLAFVPVAPGLSLSAPATGAVAQPLAFTGIVSPVKRKVTVIVGQPQADGTVVEVGRVRVTPAADGSFSGSYTPAAAGTYRLTATTAADATNAAGSSAPVDVTVA